MRRTSDRGRRSCTAGPRRGSWAWRVSFSAPRGRGPRGECGGDGAMGRVKVPADCRRGRESTRPRPFRAGASYARPVRLCGAGGRTADAAALRAHLGGGAVDVLRELRAAVEDVALDLGHPERPLEVVPGELRVERLAGEDVDRDVVLVRERVDADVALGDQDDS